MSKKLDNIPVPDTAFDRLLIDMKYRRIRPFLFGRILDVGCGVGIMVKKMFDDGFEIEGLDGSALRISEAIKRCPKTTFHTAYFKDFKPTKNNLFDTIIVSGVLEHFNEEGGDNLLKMCQEWMNPKGTLIATVPNRNALHKLVYGSSELTKEDHLVGHKRTYDFVELSQQISKAKFKVISIGGVLIKFDCNKYLCALNKNVLENWYRISNLNDTFHLASVIYVVAKK